MQTLETKTTVFEKGGPENTDTTLALALERARERGIRDVVVASSSGATGARAVEVFAGFNVIAVNGIYVEKLEEAHRHTIEEGGGRVLFHGHAFGMLGRAVKNKLGPLQVDEVIAHVLRLFGQGVKVAAEVTCMATDAALITPGTEVMAIGGSGQGADTSVILTAVHTQDFFDTRFLEIVCKPR